MAKGKLILICQSGGEFVTKDDGTLSFEGGEANAVNINHETLFDDLKLKLAEMSNLDLKTISIKYFLPGNRRNLITLRNDKDLRRMIDFHVNSVTADVFVNGKEGFDHDAVKAHANKDSGVKLAETVNHISAPSTAENPVVVEVNHQSSHTNAEHGDSQPPANSTPPANEMAHSSSPSQTSIASHQSSENGTDYDSDFTLSMVAARIKAGPNSGSPADTVKKRRRNASSTKLARETLIDDVSDRDGDKRRKRKKRKKHSNNESEHQRESTGMDDSSIAFHEEDFSENLIATWKECITGVGQDFKNVKEFRAALQKYAVANRFGYRLKKNDSNRVSGKCVNEGCSWSIHASWVPASKSFRVKKLNSSHTCGEESWKNAHPGKNLLVSVIKGKLRSSPHHRTKEIVKSISEDFGIKLNNRLVKSGIEEAREQLQGSYDKSYNRLPWFCEKLVETNPGSYVKLMRNDDKRFKFLSFSINSFMQSFLNECRPILFLDSTSFRSKYQEILLTATAVDGDDGFFPVAFCIVDNENEENWRLFLEQIKSAISSPLTITFVSDMEKGLKKCVNEVFENAFNGYSMYHLVQSFKRNLRGPFHGEGRALLPGMFLDAAHTIRLSNFKKLTEQIKQISVNGYDWIIQCELEHWTSSSFKGEQYNYIVQDVAEPYTKLIDEIRESTIMQKIEALMQMMSELINTRQTDASNWKMKLTPSKERRIQEEAFKANGLRVFMSSDTIFEVHDGSTHVVDTVKQECTCLEWKINGLPCRHAIAAFKSLGKSGYEYCSRFFTVESYRLTYSRPFNLIDGIGAPVGKDEAGAADVEVLPPAPPGPGQKKEQVKAEDPDKRTVSCSRCKGLGHNKVSCKAILEILPP